MPTPHNEIGACKTTITTGQNESLKRSGNGEPFITRFKSKTDKQDATEDNNAILKGKNANIIKIQMPLYPVLLYVRYKIIFYSTSGMKV